MLQSTGRGSIVPEHAEYPELVRLDRIDRSILEARERVAVLRARFVEGETWIEDLLRMLERSLLLKLQYRAMFIEELMSLPRSR